MKHKSSIALALLLIVSPAMHAVVNVPGCVWDLRIEGLRLRPVGPRNYLRARRVAKRIFPHNGSDIRSAYIASMLPSWLLKPISGWATAYRLRDLHYYALEHMIDGDVAGVTGLYAIDARREAWIGWYGIDASMRGKGLGRRLLAWTIHKAGELDVDTVRLWTTDADEYQAARGLYEAMGFTAQLLEADKVIEGHRVIIYSRRLKPGPLEPFAGDWREATLGG